MPLLPRFLRAVFPPSSPISPLSPLSLLSALSLLAFASVAGCPEAPSMPPPPPPKAAATVPSAAVTASAKPAEIPVDPTLAKILAHGPIVGEPLHLAGSQGKQVVVAFVGSAEAVSAAWEVVGDGAATPIALPVGVRLVGTFHRDDPLGAGDYALVQSLAVLDQPSGRFGVVRLAVGGSDAGDDAGDAEIRLVTYAHVTTVEAAKAAAPKNDAAQLAAQKALLQKASTSDAALLAAFSVAGVDLYGAYQGTFLEVEEHLPPSPPKPRLARLRELVATAAKAGACEDFVCEARDDAGNHHGSVALENVGGAWKISGFFGAKEKPPTKPPEKAGQLVTASKTTTATEEVLRARVAHVDRVLGEAPYGPTGTLGVALTDLDPAGPALVVRDGAFTAVLPLAYFGQTSFTPPSDAPPPPPPTYEVGFVDVDGDGYAEAIVRRKSVPYPSPSPVVLTQLYAVPRTLAGTSAIGTSFDVDRQMELLGAKSLDDAAKAVLAYTAPHVTDAEACKAVTKLKSKATLIAGTTADALRLVFEEPGAPTFVRVESIFPLREAKEPKNLVVPCNALHCDGNGYCGAEVEGPASTHYWFRREGKQVLVSGVAEYGGS